MSKRLVVDSSVLIAFTRKGTLTAYIERKRQEGYEILIPKAIAKELIDEPRILAEDVRKRSPILASKIAESIQAISGAIEDNLIKIEPVNYRKYSRLIDNVRKHLSKLEVKPQHTVSKGDPELITLIIQLFETHKEKVYVSSQDKRLLKALSPFRDRVEYEILQADQT